mgnify:CR=1 FL=1
MTTGAGSRELAADAIRCLFPDGVSIAWAADAGSAGALRAPEHAATRGMSPARLRTFVQGRDCAHRALAGLGITGAAVPVGEQRAPLWPPGITGSIAHAEGSAVAVAARREVATSLGVDLEAAGELAPELLDLVCTPREKERLDQSGDADLGRAIFAIKESLYKCLWPLCRRFIDFQEVEIELGRSGGRYLARSVSPALDQGTVEAVRGGWVQRGGRVCASAYLPPASAL